MTQKVFISSTYGDLIPYRKRIWEEIGKLNVKILGMEKFGARQSAPLDTCLEEVTNSDIFVGIISFRFGSLEKMTKKSFSQLEYEKAYALKKEIMIYFMSDDSLIHPFYFDKGINGSRLDNFKKILKRRHTIDTFKDPEELVIKIQDRLKDLIPDLTKTTIRPQIIDCEITRFNFHNEKWILFVGYLNEKPFEIFCTLADEEIFPVPKSLIKGRMIKIRDENGKIRFDFQYTDKYGYRKYIEGMNHVFDKHVSKYSSMITKLLQKEIKKSEIADLLDEMDQFENFSSKEWKRAVKNALKI
jgi:hypothetical protein